MESVDLLVTHASELLTLAGSKKPRIQQQMKKLGIKVAMQGEQVYLPLGNDSPPQHGDKSTVGHLV